MAWGILTRLTKSTDHPSSGQTSAESYKLRFWEGLLRKRCAPASGPEGTQTKLPSDSELRSIFDLGPLQATLHVDPESTTAATHIGGI